MNVVLAKSAGFCFGVKRAVETVSDAIESKSNKIYTYGPIIHNEEVVKELEAKGVSVIPEGSNLSEFEPGTVIIRSHGVAKNVYDSLLNAGFEIIDATCPFVKKIHKIVLEQSNNGAHILIAGDEKHPEVQGIIGWINSDYNVISTPDEIDKFLDNIKAPICFVSQTTFNYKKFQELVEIINEKGYDVNVVNTICNATEERQTEASKIAKSVDAMLVIGDKNSSNTRKLFEICKKECNDTYYIQTVEDLSMSALQPFTSVGITAGASTPNNIIEEVQKKCQK